MAKESITKIFKDNVEVIVNIIDMNNHDVKQRLQELKDQQENLDKLKAVDVDRLKSTVFQL